MKKCPYCKAEIEDSARFCLYCMSALGEKEPVSPPRKRRWLPLMIAALVLLAVVLFLLSRCSSDTGAPEPQATETTAPTSALSEPQTEVPATVPSGDAETEAPSSVPVEEEAIPTEVTQPGETEEAPPEDVPAEPSQPTTTKPTETEPSQPITTPPTEPKPTQPAVTQPTAPTQPVTTKPAGTEPSQPVTTPPTEPKPSQPAVTQPTEPTQPVTTKPTETEPSQPTATQPAETEPSQPVTTPPTEPKPSQPAVTQPTEPSQPTETTSAETEPFQPTTAPQPCTHRYQATENQQASCTGLGQITHTCTLCGDSYQETIPAIGHSYREATCLQPQVCKECSATKGSALGHSYEKGTCIRCGTPDPTDPRTVYEYRAPQGGDQLPSGQYNPATDVVITGVKTLHPEGIYDIPAYIDGYRVVGIMSLTFSGTDARRVTLGKNIIYVAQNAFSSCYNIEALYVRSDNLYLSRSAFIPASSRNCTMKIYCSATCTINDALDGKCYLKDKVRVYGGEYHEWNG